ncbi:MAG: hypothetical protein IJY65_02815 [Clostridia bacterium]|nr:hypothetical protein [Clostridia bacterium]
MQKLKKITVVAALCVLLLVSLVLQLISPSSAYFLTVFDKLGVNSVMVELIFDRLDFTNTAITDLGYANVDADGNEIPWGSEQNPYVISQKFHIQNLSVLQNSGFFLGRQENGVPVQSYFLVCNPDGTPVAIDCGGMTIEPVGTTELPFTGVISGAPIAGSATYKNADGESYGVSTSTIANLVVDGKSDTPDLGFFGYAGYYGSYNENDATLTGGYASTIENLLFADVTIKSSKSLLDTLLDAWWALWKTPGIDAETGGEIELDHTHFKDTREETHHVGIIAGHAEFATIKNVSVYYSDNVAAFDLVSDSSESITNYYSSTGLIGLLQYVNPAVVTDADGNQTLDGSGGVSDSQITGDGEGGGGGEESGTLTGYFLAESLFNQHEEYLTAQGLGTKDSYNVIEMKAADGTGLFKTVQMNERQNIGDAWVPRTYYYFQDSVFTFAMSMSTAEGETIDTVDPAKSDYIQKIWKLDENGAAPNLSATENLTDWKYDVDPDAPSRVSYYLEAVTSMTENAYYVLAYFDKGADATSGTADDVLYVFNPNDVNGTDGYVHAIAIGALSAAGATDDELNGTVTYFDAASGGGIESLKLIGTKKAFYDYAFYYNTTDGYSIQNPTLTDYKFGVTSTASSVFGSYDTPSTVYSTAGASGGGGLSAEAAYIYDWDISAYNTTTQKGKFSISKTYSLSTWIDERFIWSKLSFSDESISFSSQSYDNSTDRDNGFSLDDSNYFTILKVMTNTLDSDGTIASDGLGSAGENKTNEELSPMNIVPTTSPDSNGTYVPDTIYDFDPSKYVLEYVGTSTEEANGQSAVINNYKLSPIRSYRLNNGTGDLLSQINHTAKLYKTHSQNYQLTIGNTFIGDLVGDWLDTNTGGVLNTTIGNSESATDLYSIPTGMIAFEIREASTDNPSYINIIVAVNPEQETTGTIGLWAMNKSDWSQSFDLSSPAQSFDLPISKTAKGNGDCKYLIKISERVDEVEQDGKMYYGSVVFCPDCGKKMSIVCSDCGYRIDDAENSDAQKETSYLYLGGDTVLVYYSFEITATGVYMIGSKAGPLSVSYFSVSGAAGAGADGMTGSPLGYIDFVYDNNGNIITVDKLYTGEQFVSNENYDQYYPSFLFVSMLPEKDDGGSIVKIQREQIYLKRYIAGKDADGNETDTSGTKRHMKMTGANLTKLRGVSEILQDLQDDIDE